MIFPWEWWNHQNCSPENKKSSENLLAEGGSEGLFWELPAISKNEAKVTYIKWDIKIYVIYKSKSMTTNRNRTMSFLLKTWKSLADFIDSSMTL